MKKLYTLLIFLHLNSIAFSQTVEYLDVNNIKAGIYGVKSLFENYGNGSAGFEVPKGSGIHSIYSSGLWIGGLKNDSLLKMSAQLYSSIGTDFQPGPIMDSIHYQNERIKWDKLWKINREEINFHIANYANQNYTPIPAILSWPGNGNPSMGQSQKLAPFKDLNSNGIYEPLLGDYPLIKGDQSIYFIMNDDTIHTLSNGDRLKAEFHVMAYGFNCSSSPALMNTLFLNYRIINKSNDILTRLKIGNWTDGDVGNYDDDYVGSDVQNSLYYFYNGDTIDENNGGASGYEKNPPAIGIVFLAGGKNDNDGIDNPISNNFNLADSLSGTCYKNNGAGFGDGIIDNERSGMSNFVYHNKLGPAQTSDPYQPLHYINYLNSTWKDGTLMTYGGTGYLSGGNKTRYMFPGESDPFFCGHNGNAPGGIWNELKEGNPTGDRRGVGSFDAFTFKPGDVQEADFAFVWARDAVDSSAYSGIRMLQVYADSLHKYFRSNKTPCGSMSVGLNSPPAKLKKEGLSLFPNPSNGKIKIDCENTNTEELRILNIMGETILIKKNPIFPETIDLGNVNPGTYFLLIKTSGGSLTRRMVRY